MSDNDERAPMTTPDPSTRSADGSGQSAWGAVARLLSVQLLAVVAVTAVITGIYALAGGHGNNAVTAGSTTKDGTASTAPTSPPASTPPASTPAASPPASSAPPASPTASNPAPEAASRLKVDVLNQSGSGGIAATTATRVRALGWTVGRVDNFRGNVSKTTVYYPKGEAPAAHELAGALPGKPRVLPRFSTLADKRLTLIIVG